MNTKKRCALAILIALSMVILAGAAVNATANTDIAAVDSGGAR